jgi:hypothetical protein
MVALFPLRAAAQWTFDADLTRLYDNNLSRAQRESDIIRDRAWTARAALGRVFSFDTWDTSVRGEARGARHDNYSGLDHAALGLGAGARRKLGLGLTAPWLAADATLLRERYDEDVRDGDRALASLTLGKRFNERLDTSISASYDWRHQSHDLPTTGLSGRPFSVQGRSLAVRGSFALTDQALLLASAGTRRGDVTSSTRRNSQIFRESDAIANDPAFGPDFIAYRLTGARSDWYSLGLSWALGRQASINASVLTDRVKPHGDLRYRGDVYSVALVYRR